MDRCLMKIYSRAYKKKNLLLHQNCSVANKNKPCKIFERMLD